MLAALQIELGRLQLPHWLMILGGVLVVLGTIGVLFSAGPKESD
jgi:hypothetical protein